MCEFVRSRRRRDRTKFPQREHHSQRYRLELVGFTVSVKRDGAVGERCSNRRRHTVRSAGGATSAYADMSSENAGEKPARRKPQGS